MKTQTTLTLRDRIRYIESEIQDQYLNDPSPRPWIVGFSGGKDSTILLQLVWNVLKGLPPEYRRRRVYVVCNDTLVENPQVVRFIEGVLDRLEVAAAEQYLPVSVHRTFPELNDSFWVNLIGRGYPAPNNVFRWCTERLKIKPTTKFILDTISQNGEAIILLGTRRDESAQRSRSLNRHATVGQRLRKHMLPHAYVYAPVAELTTDEVWQYLASVPAPWGGKHHDLITLYRNASGGDCPLVIDTTTPSCGQSRFGCWVCTVVKADKSMEALVDNGAEWMEVFLELRDYLIETRDNPQDYRSKYGRDGKLKPDDRWGPYTPETRAEILRRVLRAQKMLREEWGEEVELISLRELMAIQAVWAREPRMPFHVSTLVNEIEPKFVVMNTIEDQRAQLEGQLLLEACGGDVGQVELIQKLVSAYSTKETKLRKRGLEEEFNFHVDEYIKHTLQTEETAA